MENEIQGLYNTNPKQHITIYDEAEREIRRTFKEEETAQDKKFFLQDINRVITELWRVLE